ncbi:BglG family transcription antiterminator [Traorella massiliensis]|uniref:BglG family transcription antiterminator n=1 Tax=Traorella massiliensis TaxID=1903263 RepID=UPI0008F8C94C|nr:PTS sugar transporter subunit IIA [Traorella massiliensis]
MEKKYEILKYLLNQTTPVSSSVIQEVFGISRRSIINYTKQLNEEFGNIIKSSNLGYEIINKEKVSTIFNDISDTSFFDSYEKRSKYILEKLLLNKEDVTVEDFMNDLYISESTFNKDLARLRAELKNSDLYINTKNGRLFIVGEVRKKHKYLLSLLNKELVDSMFSIVSLQNFFEKADIQKIRSVILNNLEKNDYKLDDYSILNYVLHLAICIETSQTNNPISFSRSVDLPFDTHFQKIIVSIYEDLKKEYPDSNFTLDQIFDASVLMSTRATSSKMTNLTLDEIDNYVGKEIKDLLITIIHNVYSNYGIDLNNDDFIVRFAFHIKNLLIRLHENMQISSNNFISIKNDYPFLYMIAVYISSLISQTAHCDLPENEISYIALHLGVLMETERQNIQHVNCEIVIYDYHDLGKNIFDKISANVNNIHLTDIVSSYEDIDKSTDLILTTLETNPAIHIRQVHINVLPTKKDIENVANAVRKIQEELQEEEFAKKIKQFFKEELMFFNIDFSSGNHAISYICDEMEKLGYVNSDFKEDIYRHEKELPTEYNNIAIPHPLSDSDVHIHQSAIAVWINKKPVKWVNNEVNFIFMISLRPEDRSLFLDIFNVITTAMTNKKITEELLDCNNFADFIRLIYK